MDSIPEDWKLEIETLEAIYMDQFKKIAPNIFQIYILPNPDSLDNSENAVSVLVDVTLKNDYPNQLPSFIFKQFKGISPKHTKELLSVIEEKGKEFLGMQMIFPLIEIIKEWLVEQSKKQDICASEALKYCQKELEEAAIRKEEEEYVRKEEDYQGEPVNKINFDNWFKVFLHSHPEKPQWDNPQNDLDPRLTGKQLFERAASSDISLEQLEMENAECQIEWSLFS